MHHDSFDIVFDIDKLHHANRIYQLVHLKEYLETKNFHFPCMVTIIIATIIFNNVQPSGFELVIT